MVKQLKWSSHEDLAIKKKMAVRREEYLDYMTFQRNDRPLFTEIFGPIVGLKEEWEEQGATPQELDFSAFPYRCEAHGFIPINTCRIGGCQPKVIEDTDQRLLYRDDLGRTMNMFKGVATVPLPLDYPVNNMDDWLKVKSLYAFSEGRFAKDWQRVAHEHLEAGRVVCVDIPGGFDEPRQLMGAEQVCIAYHEQPELIHDILKTIGQMAFRVLDHVSARVQIDLLSVHEDLAGKAGPLAGPGQIDEFIRPYYRRIWDMLADRGVRLFDLDSDGDINLVIPAFLETGVNCMHPMEPAANVDIVKIREEYGTRLAFYGGIDKYALRRSREEIIAELEYKIPPMVATGGCVLGLDHRIPNGTSLENYRFYINKAWEIINREAESSQ